MLLKQKINTKCIVNNCDNIVTAYDETNTGIKSKLFCKDHTSYIKINCSICNRPYKIKSKIYKINIKNEKFCFNCSKIIKNNKKIYTSIKKYYKNNIESKNIKSDHIIKFFKNNEKTKNIVKKDGSLLFNILHDEKEKQKQDYKKIMNNIIKNYNINFTIKLEKNYINNINSSKYCESNGIKLLYYTTAYKKLDNIMYFINCSEIKYTKKEINRFHKYILPYKENGKLKTTLQDWHSWKYKEYYEKFCNFQHIILIKGIKDPIAKELIQAIVIINKNAISFDLSLDQKERCKKYISNNINLEYIKELCYNIFIL